jgi:hypothetical protein
MLLGVDVSLDRSGWSGVVWFGLGVFFCAPCVGFGFWLLAFGLASLRIAALLCAVHVQLHPVLFPAGRPFPPSLCV